MKNLSRFAALAICCAVVLIAEDFWQKKPYTAWGEKDAQRILQNSPWAHQVSINVGGAFPSNEGGTGRRGRGSDSIGGSDATPGEMDNPNMNGPNSRGRGSRGGASMESLDSGGAVMLVVRWESATPVRQATVVAKLGREKATSEEAARFLNQTLPGYVISVMGLPANMGRMPADKLNEIAKTASSLRIKDKEAIPATKAEAVPHERNVDIYFVFSKSTPIELDDKEVEFALRLGRIDVRRKFRLKEMVIGDKLEL